MTNTLIVGTGKRSQRFIDLVDRVDRDRKIIGLVDSEESRVGGQVKGHRILGSIDNLPDVLHSNVVDEVVFIVPRSWLGKMEDVIHSCETEGLKVTVAVDFFEPKFARASQTDLGGFPLLSFESAPPKKLPLAIKRAIDIAASAAALVLLSPLIAATALAVRFTSPGPILFRQERCGLNGRRFRLYKFRTMVVDAEKRLAELKKHNEMKGPAFKMTNDPRVTPIGKWLRKLSLDELPQLWNILQGHMSIVGPRPPIPAEVNEYDGWHRRRLSMRPGLTCLWQVSGRNRITNFDEWMKLDLQYIDKWSLWLDVKIILKTIPVVLFGVGAK